MVGCTSACRSPATATESPSTWNDAGDGLVEQVVMGEFGDDVLGCPDIDALVERVVDEVGIEVLEMRVRDEHRTHAVEGRRWSKSAGIDQDAGRLGPDPGSWTR